jgi:CelD/BcsL family acetyltransferase involved in cellulose biosynthesis
MAIQLDTPILNVSDNRRLADLRVEIVRDIGSLECHAVAWNRLALAAPQRLPMLAHAWVAAYLEHRLDQGETWCCALAYAEDTLVGVLCVVVTPHRLFGHTHPRLRAPYDSHTRSGDALLAKGREVEILQALLAALRRAIPGYLGLELRGVREGSRTLVALECGLPRSVIVRADDRYGLFVRTSGTYEDFQARLSPGFRKNLRSTHKRLAKLPGVEIESLTGDRTTEADLARFTAIEASGWKGHAGTALALSQPLVAFYSTLLRNLAEQGWLVWCFLDADGRTIAGNLMVRFGSSLIGLKTAYDESFARFSPGKIIFEHTAQRAFADCDIDEINCLSDASWQHQWHAERSNYFHLWLYPRQPLALVFGVLPTRAWLLVKRVLRPLVRRIRLAIERRSRAVHRTEGESA